MKFTIIPVTYLPSSSSLYLELPDALLGSLACLLTSSALIVMSLATRSPSCFSRLYSYGYSSYSYLLTLTLTSISRAYTYIFASCLGLTGPIVSSPPIRDEY